MNTEKNIEAARERFGYFMKIIGEFEKEFLPIKNEVQRSIYFEALSQSSEFLRLEILFRQIQIKEKYCS